MRRTDTGGNPKTKELREFGLVLGVLLLFIGLFPLYREEPLRLWAVIPGAAFAALGLVLPKLLVLPFRLWMKFAHVLMTVNTKIILTVIFVLLVCPIGLMLRLFGKDLLGLKASGDTYWVERGGDEAEVDFERMF